MQNVKPDRETFAFTEDSLLCQVHPILQLAVLRLNLFSSDVPAEGTCKHYIILRSMANYNIIRKLLILPKMVRADS